MSILELVLTRRESFKPITVFAALLLAACSGATLPVEPEIPPMKPNSVEPSTPFKELIAPQDVPRVTIEYWLNFLARQQGTTVENILESTFPSEFGPNFRELRLATKSNGMNFESLVFSLDRTYAFFIRREVPSFGVTREVLMNQTFMSLPPASRDSILKIPMPTIDGQPLLGPNEAASFISSRDLTADFLVKRLQGPPIEFAVKELGFRPTIENVLLFLQASSTTQKFQVYRAFSVNPYLHTGRSMFEIQVSPTGEVILVGDGTFVHVLGGEVVQGFSEAPKVFSAKQLQRLLSEAGVEVPQSGAGLSMETLAKSIGVTTLNALNVALMTGLVETSAVAMTYKNADGLPVTLDKASQVVTNRTFQGAEQQKVCLAALNGVTEQNAGPIVYSYDLLPVEGSGVGPMTPVTQIETKDQDGGNIEQWFCDYFIQFRISQTQDGRPVLHFDRPTASGQGVSAHVEGKLDNVSVDVQANQSIVLNSDFTYTVTTSTGYEYVIGTGYGPETSDKWFYVTITKAPYNLSQPS